MGQANTYSAPGSDLHELKNYVVSRLLWNMTREPADEFAYFLKHYYGAGAFAVKLYMDTMVGSMQVRWYPTVPPARGLQKKQNR